MAIRRRALHFVPGIWKNFSGKTYGHRVKQEDGAQGEREIQTGARGRLKSPEGTAPGREIPLIGVADVSLRGLGSPEEGGQKTFWSPSLSIVS